MKNWKQVFAIIWTGQFISILSSTTVNFAIILWLSIETGSAEILAFAAIASLLPQSILGFFTGALVDRWNRKAIMILSDAFIAVCTLILAFIVMSGEFSMGYVYFILALRSAGSAFHMPAMQASVPLLAPEGQLVRIAAINQMIQSVSYIAGPALGALLINMMDIGKVLMFDVFGAVIACTSLLFVAIPNPKKNETTKISNIFRDINEGLKEIVSRKGMNYLFLFSVIATFFIMPVSVLFPLMTLQHFNGTAFQVSLIEITWSSGMLVGGASLSLWKGHVKKIILVNTAYILLGLSFLLTGILSSNGFIYFVILTIIGGVSGTLYNSAFTATLQEKIDPAILGRIFSTFMSISILPSIIGLLGTGFMAEHIGLTNTFIIAGGVICIIGIVSFCIPSIMRLDKKN